MAKSRIESRLQVLEQALRLERRTERVWTGEEADLMLDFVTDENRVWIPEDRSRAESLLMESRRGRPAMSVDEITRQLDELLGLN